MNRRLILSVVLVIGIQAGATAQGLNLLASPTDPDYITDYTEDITVRLFASRKIMGYQVAAPDQPNEVEYSPNDHTSVGFGFSYKFLGININLNVPALNNDDETYGKTKSLDLASYFYLRKFMVDAFAQVYKGQYLSDNDILTSAPSDQPYLLRPDLETQNYGVNAHYIFNHTKFSYRAAFLQNEWQRRSAGSFLAGINAHYIRAKADSAIVPLQLATVPGEPYGFPFNRTSAFSLGIDGGYAHTFVLKEHWFTTLALMAGVGGNRTSLRIEDDNTTAEANTTGLHLNGTVRFALGYNSDRWFAGAYYVNFLNRNYAGSTSDLWQQINSGVYRFVVAKRFAFRQGKAEN